MTSNSNATLMFQPTLPLRGATCLCLQRRPGRCVSTHAPLAGSDNIRFQPLYIASMFQPTLPLRGATTAATDPVKPTVFQPTLPLRGATRYQPAYAGLIPGFNPRSPCGERHRSAPARTGRLPVSTHAPLAGSDIRYYRYAGEVLVSTHAPLAGSDPRRRISRRRPASFNPRSPCGERRWTRQRARGSLSRFNPRSPCGERPGDSRLSPMAHSFNPRSPCGERRFAHRCRYTGMGFNPRSPCGERQAQRIGDALSSGFNPRSPCGERRGKGLAEWQHH